MKFSDYISDAMNQFRIMLEIGWVGDHIRYKNAAVASEEILMKHPEFGDIKAIMGAMEFAKWKGDSFEMPSTPILLKKLVVAIATTVLGALSLILLVQELFTRPGNFLGLFILLLLGPTCLWTGQSTFRRLLTAFRIKSFQQAEQTSQSEVP